MEIVSVLVVVLVLSIISTFVSIIVSVTLLNAFDGFMARIYTCLCQEQSCPPGEHVNMSNLAFLSHTLRYLWKGLKKPKNLFRELSRPLSEGERQFYEEWNSIKTTSSTTSKDR